MPSVTPNLATAASSDLRHASASPAVDSKAMAASARQIFLNNGEAAQFLNLSPRTLEKHRVIGGGPRFRKFGRRVVYALADLENWANSRSCESTSDPQYLAIR